MDKLTRQCEENILKAIENSVFIRLMLKSLKSQGCEVDLARHLACEPCPPNRRIYGGFDQPNSQVFLCSDRCVTASKVEEILAHELVHLYDHCTVKLDLKNENHLACTEIRYFSYDRTNNFEYGSCYF